MTTITGAASATALLLGEQQKQGSKSSPPSGSSDNAAADEPATVTLSAAAQAFLNNKDNIRERLQRLEEYQRVYGEFAAREDEYRAKSEALWERWRVAMDRLAEESRRNQPPPFAIIKDNAGKQVGYIDQSGGLAITDSRYYGLVSAVSDGQRSLVNSKYDRFDVISRALGGNGSIERTGVDVEPPKADRTEVNAASAALRALKEERDQARQRLDALRVLPWDEIVTTQSGAATTPIEGRLLLSAPGIRKLSSDEAAQTHLELRNRINLSAETKAKMGLGEILETLNAQDARHLADTLAASAERNARSRRIKELADQIYAEVHRLKGSYVEPPAFAVISDENGKAVGKVLQGGGVWFDGNEIWRVKDNAALKLLVDKVWEQTDDPKQAQQRLYEGLRELVGTRGTVTLTGVNVDPPPFGSELLTSLQEEFYGLLGSQSSDAAP